MARLSREFVKLETRLLNDHRFFTLDEKTQLVFIKILLVTRMTCNRVPKQFDVLKAYLRTKLYENSLSSCIEKIKVAFPKFKEGNDFYYFEDYESRFLGTKLKTPNPKINSGVDEDEDEDEDEDNRGTNTKVKIKKPKTCFKPPSLSDIKDYCLERQNRVDCEKFFNFYESKGWMVGKNKMKDWQAAVRNWEKDSKGQVNKIKAGKSAEYKELQEMVRASRNY